MARISRRFKAIISLYTDGFRSMTVGRKLWVLILIKIAIFFLVLKLFFFPDILAKHYVDNDSRADAVRYSLQAR